MLRLMMSLLMLSLISSCKYMSPIEICKYRYETDLCICRMRDMLHPTPTKAYSRDLQYCFRGVIVTEDSWPILDSYLQKAGRKVKKRH